MAERILVYWGVARWDAKTAGWDEMYMRLYEGNSPLIAKAMGAVIVGPYDTKREAKHELGRMLDNYCRSCGELRQVYYGTTDHRPEGLCDNCRDEYHRRNEGKVYGN